MTPLRVLAATETRLVRDKTTGLLHYFMRSLNGAAVVDDDGGATDLRLVGDAMNEVAAAALGQEAFPDLFLEIGFAEDPSSIARPMLRQTHLTSAFPNAIAYHYDQAAMMLEDPQTLTVVMSPDVVPLAEPQQALAVHVFDYLTANSERHSGNLASVDTVDGRYLVAIQNGGCNHALIGQLEDRFAPPARFAAIAARRREINEILLQPETVPYDIWQTQWAFAPMTGMPTRWIRAEVRAAYGDDSARIKKDADAVLEAFRNVDHHHVGERLLERYPTIDEYDKTQLHGLIEVWHNRRNMIRAEDVVTVMS